MEALLWVAIGGLAGAFVALAFRGDGRFGTLGWVVVGCVAAVVGGLAVDAVFGEIAQVRVTIRSGSSFGSTAFGLGPAIAAGLTAAFVLGGVQRTQRSSR